MVRRLNFALAFLFVLLLFGTGRAKEGRLLRQPDIYKNKVAFVYAGDIWVAPLQGGVARKLTSFDGMELFPKFSPDGKWSGCSGGYSGTREIYVMPSEGGVPRQLTFYPDVGQMPPRGGWDNIPIDWTPDGRKILFRSNRTPYGRRMSRYFLIDAFKEELEQPLQIPEGGPATLSPDGTKLAYDIKSREFRTWKRYKAGRAQDVWIYDLKENTIERITRYPGTDNFPMWVGHKIFFTSDRASVRSNKPTTLNIFAYDLGTKKIHQVTHFKKYDCLWPSRGRGGIVFENGGFIYFLNPETEEIRKISIEINDDRPHALPAYKNVSKFIQSFALSPSAKRAVFSARGEVFTVPRKHGDIVNLSQTSGVREMSVDWSPDGKWISYLSDKTGEYELYLKKYHSSQPALQMTHHTDAWITGYQWAPNSKWIVLTDKKNRLRLLNVQTKKLREIDRGVYSAISGAQWSADSRWVAYTKDFANHMTGIFVYSLDQKKSFQLTKDTEDNYSPTFDPDGKYLYFISRRNYNWGTRHFDARLYVGTLRKDLESPFAPLNDDETPEKPTKKKKTGKKAAKKNVPVVIEPEGFSQRVVAFPLPTGGYRSLRGIQGGVLYIRGGKLTKYDLKQRKATVIMSGVSSYVLSANEKSFLYGSGKTYGIAELRPKQKSGAGKLNLSKMTVKIIPTDEWQQIYHDAWLIMRDWFYDPKMHHVDWKKMYDKYEELIPYVASRADLDYVIGELVGELNCGHTYVMSGDMPRVKRVPVGVLGCDLKPDGKFFRIASIFPSENWEKGTRSPLTEPGVNVREGEFLVGIDGHILHTNENPYKYLENKVGVEVQLLVNSRPSEKGARKVTVTPVASELALRHLKWEEHNRAIVDSLSGGQIGYIYVPNTSFEGFKNFYKGWYAQADVKSGLIIDERYNGGGSIPAPMIFDMSHPILNYWARRNLPLYTTPLFANEGPKVMLINGRSSSGGDAFPAYFRTMKLGLLMGQTTWGGLVGYSWNPRFVDGGHIAVPAFAYVNRQGKWDVESYGVKPDVEVFDDPTQIRLGREPMLERAVQTILTQLKENPPKQIVKPPSPDRR